MRAHDAGVTAPAHPTSPRRALLAWSLYDLANTVFFLLVATRYFPEQLALQTGSESAVALAYVPAMLLSALLSPALGALVDRIGRARSLTFALTLACCAATTAMAAAHGALALMLLYVVARFCYEMAAVPYNALLPGLVGVEAVGAASGAGVALGYLGNLFAFGLILAFDLDQSGYGALYLLAAALFLIFTLPMRFCVVEQPASRPLAAPLTARALLLLSFREGFAALRRQLAPRERRAFFFGIFFVCDSVNTVLAQVARYAARREGLALSSHGVTLFLLGIQLSCIVGGFVLGRESDRRGGRRTTLLAVALLFLGLLIAQFAPWWGVRVAAIGTLGGAGLAGIWAASRHWLVQMVPRAELGEAFGVYGLAQRASLLTLFPFTALVDRGVASGAASYSGSVGVLLAALAIGFGLLWRARVASA